MQRDPGALGIGLGAGYGPEQGFCCPWAVACRVPVLVVERGVCERGSPAGHGGPAEWARTEVSQECATFDARAGA
jgi:hypothetical protein